MYCTVMLLEVGATQRLCIRVGWAGNSGIVAAAMCVQHCNEAAVDAAQHLMSILLKQHMVCLRFGVAVQWLLSFVCDSWSGSAWYMPVQLSHVHEIEAAHRPCVKGATLHPSVSSKRNGKDE